jgi:hypothetical protein
LTYICRTFCKIAEGSAGQPCAKIAEGSLASRLYARNSNLLHNKAGQSHQDRRKAITSSPASVRPREANRSNIEIKHHDDRMKSARYKLEAFVRDYSDMTEWKEVIEAIKTQLGAKHV